MYEPRVYIFSYTGTTFLFWGQIEAFLPRRGVLCGLLGSSGDIFQHIFFLPRDFARICACIGRLLRGLRLFM